MRSASALITVTRPASAGARSASVRGSSSASTRSISTATIAPGPAASRARVSEPSPGPTSSTTSPGPGAASAAIRRTVPCSTTKFWPSRLDGRTPSRSARFLTSAGLSSRTGGSVTAIASRWRTGVAGTMGLGGRMGLGGGGHGLPGTEGALRGGGDRVAELGQVEALTSARQRRVYATWAGALGRPRFGTGVRNGASVSASRRSGGAAAAASRSGWALVNVTLPANDIT